MAFGSPSLPLLLLLLLILPFLLLDLFFDQVGKLSKESSHTALTRIVGMAAGA